MSNIGVHVNAWVPGVAEVLLDWGPPLIVSLQPDPALRTIKRKFPQTTIVLRRHFQEHENEARGLWNRPDCQPREIARYVAERVAEHAAPIADVVDYVVGFNEPVLWNEAAIRRWVEYEIERVRLSPLPCAVCNFSVAHPDLYLWQFVYPVFEEVLRRGAGAIATHEYAWPRFPPTPDGVYIGRMQRVWDALPDRYRKIPWLITEFGLDQLLAGGGQVGGWQLTHTPQQYADELRRISQFYDREHVRVKIAVYCLGVSDMMWSTYDILRSGVDRALSDQAINERRQDSGNV